MLDQSKNILIDTEIQEKLNVLQAYFKSAEGVEYSEAAIFRRAIHMLHKTYIEDSENQYRT